MGFLRQRLAWFVTVAVAAASLFCLAAQPVPVAAAPTDLFQDVCTQGGAGDSPACSANGDNTLSGPNGIIIKVSNIFAFVTGMAAVFVIMVGGFMYITAAGDAGKANSGRSAIMYACIGLVVVVLARAIIGFVVTKF